jgi:hypothetical protein
MRLIRSAICAAVVVALSGSSRLTAQATRGLQDQPIPRDLAEALLAGQAGRQAQSIVVGELPPALVGKLFVPTGARILGGTYGSSGSTAILTSADKPDALVEQFRREMPKLGWTWFEQPNAMAYASLGFKDAPGGAVGTAPTTGPQMYCGSGMTLTVRIDPQGILESRITASVNSNNMCAMMQQQAARMSSMNDPFRTGRTPLLVNPPGARNQLGLCPPNNMNGMNGRTELSTQLTPDELFVHYGHQLADSGWKPSGGVTVSRTWTKIDSTGTALEFELLIKTFAEVPRCRKLTSATYGR